MRGFFWTENYWYGATVDSEAPERRVLMARAERERAQKVARAEKAEKKKFLVARAETIPVILLILWFTSR